MGVYLVHDPLHNFSPEVGGGRLHGNGRLQGTLQYIYVYEHCHCLLACMLESNFRASINLYLELLAVLVDTDAVSVAAHSLVVVFWL